MSPPMNLLTSPHRPLFGRLVSGAALALLTCVLAACGGGSGGSAVAAVPSTGTSPTGESPASSDTKPEMRCAP